MPGFHNNIANTVEEVVQFYVSGCLQPVDLRLRRRGVQVRQGPGAAVGAFLRAINALENVRSATADIDSIAGLRPLKVRRRQGSRLRDIEDAIKDLTDGPADHVSRPRHGRGLTAARRKLLRGLLLLDPTQFAAAKVDLARASDLMLE